MLEKYIFEKFNFIKGKLLEYIKFNIVGMSNFAVSQVLYLTLYLVFKIDYIVAYSITTVFSVTLSYLLNAKYTFNQEKYSLSKYVLTILVYVCEYLINISIIKFLVGFMKISAIIAPFIAPVFSTIPVFFLMRFAMNLNSKNK